ncbi:MAG TPA: beta-N-acetylhexosaminidase [Candidatus Dormibacteraeota bacterium]|nr:beta-N-acetylhexosaminidase [Candidatus Dormibacteraeota bacterium]
MVSLSDIIPAPVSIRPHPGDDFVILASSVIVVSVAGAEQPAVAWLAGLLRRGTGYAIPIVPAADSSLPIITFALSVSEASLGEEGYRLTVSSAEVRIQASTDAGLFHGAQTLRQLLPPEIETRDSQGTVRWVVPGGEITDHPRYRWRGAMLDVARHFFSVADVKRYIDLLALYKCNMLHLHLTDDQGWRIAIESWPLLASVGGSTAVDGDPGGYYSAADYRDIVAYAASRCISIVPEIDAPGHVNAALAAYPELSCAGTHPSLYTGIEVGFSTLCPDKPITERFLDEVIGELAALTPGDYIHIGGDEARSTQPADYIDFVQKLTTIVTAHGKIPIGWAEISKAPLSAGVVAQYWDVNDSGRSAHSAAAQGVDVILSPANPCYLDLKYDAATQLGLSWAGTVSVRAAYDWDPGGYGVPEHQILGIEAALWTETLRTVADVEYMAFPRLPGIAEVGWSPQYTHNWAAYRQRLAAQASRWVAMGVNFHRAAGVEWAKG